MSKALFLDRDGTLILDKHYLADPAGVELIPGVADALRRARFLGYKLFLFTNQSGIARGYYTMEAVHRCNERMEELLGLPTPLFTDICIAPEGPEEPAIYRKPSPRFILESIAKFKLDPKQCWMAGDRDGDLEAGIGAGVNAAALCTGKYTAEQWATRVPKGVPIYPSIVELVAALEAASVVSTTSK